MTPPRNFAEWGAPAPGDDEPGRVPGAQPAAGLLPSLRRWGASRWGLLAGLVAGLLIAFGSFWQFLVVLLLTVIGAAVGWVLENRVDLGEFLASRRR